jgi:hypothetical protein
MKRVFILIPFFACLLCTSCIDILEEFFINKDGSGKYLVTYDLSAVLEPEFQNMLGGLSEMSGDESTSDINFNDLNSVELDSTSSMTEMGSTLNVSEQEADLLSRSFMHMEISGSSKVFKIAMEVNFNDASEIEQFFTLFEKAQAEDGQALPLSQFSTPTRISIKKNTLVRTSDAAEATDSEVENSMAMMGMFFAEAVYTSKYYFPKKIKKTTMEGASIDGNVLSIENNFLDVMLSKADLSGEIKFK